MSELSGLYKRQGETRSKFYGGRGRTKSFSDAIGFSRGSANIDIQDSIRTGKNIQDNILVANELVNYSEDVSSTRSKAKEAINILSKGSENKFEQISGGDTTLKNLWERRGDFFNDPTLFTELGQRLAHLTGITDPKYSFDGKTYTTNELAAMLGYLKAGFSADYLNPNNNRNVFNDEPTLSDDTGFYGNFNLIESNKEMNEMITDTFEESIDDKAQNLQIHPGVYKKTTK